MMRCVLQWRVIVLVGMVGICVRNYKLMFLSESVAAGNRFKASTYIG
jgi:hypothetical protein